jgi:hypothetical protein
MRIGMPTTASTEAESSAQLAAKLSDLINSSWITHAIRCGIELGVFEALDEAPSSGETLGQRLECRAATLERLLRALSCLELCTESEDGVFALTPMGRLLVHNGRGSLREWARLWCDELAHLWADLPEAVRQDRGVRELRGTGSAGFSRLEGDAARAALFHGAMAANSYWVAQAFANDVPLEGIRCLVDVGGGHGALLAAVLAVHRTLRGVVFDLPHATDGAHACIERAGLTERVDVVSGSFFEHVPPADAHVLKSVLHDWNDEDCVRILRRCREATTRRGLLYVVERLTEGRLSTTLRDRAWARSDLNMLVAHGTGERTVHAYMALLRAAGYALVSVRDLAMGTAVIEAKAT